MTSLNTQKTNIEHSQLNHQLRLKAEIHGHLNMIINIHFKMIILKRELML